MPKSEPLNSTNWTNINKVPRIIANSIPLFIEIPLNTSCFQVAMIPEETNRNVFNMGNPKGSNILTKWDISWPSSPQYKLYLIAAKKPEKKRTSLKTNKEKEIIKEKVIILLCFPNMEASRVTSRPQKYPTKMQIPKLLHGITFNRNIQMKLTIIDTKDIAIHKDQGDNSSKF